MTYNVTHGHNGHQNTSNSYSYLCKFSIAECPL